MYEWVKSGSSIREWLVNYNSIAFILEIFYEKNCRSMNELCTNLIFTYKKILKNFLFPLIWIVFISPEIFTILKIIKSN